MSTARDRVQVAEKLRQLPELFGRTPPHSLEAEMALLGSWILDGAVIDECLAIVKSPSAFYDERHSAIAQAILDVHERGADIDLVQLQERLRVVGQYDQVGGDAYLVSLVGGVPSSATAPFYAKIVAAKAEARKIIDAAGSAIFDAYASTGDQDEIKAIVDRIEGQLGLVQTDVAAGPRNITEDLQAELNRMEEAEGKGPIGITTGMSDLDERTNGLQPGELIILAARPSMGKTALAMNIAEAIACPRGFDRWGRKAETAGVLLVSLEMTREEIVRRLLCSRARVDASRVRAGVRLEKDEWQRLMKAQTELDAAKLYVDDDRSLTVAGIRRSARRLARDGGIRAVIVDYLQLVTPAQSGSRSETRENQVAAISRGLKGLAGELKIPVLVLAQLNREVENRSTNRPRMSDLRESGSIEQDADVVMLLHREAYYRRDDEKWQEEHSDLLEAAEVIIAKQRNGPPGVVRLRWDAKHTRFDSWKAEQRDQTWLSTEPGE